MLKETKTNQPKPNQNKTPKTKPLIPTNASSWQKHTPKKKIKSGCQETFMSKSRLTSNFVFFVNLSNFILFDLISFFRTTESYVYWMGWLFVLIFSSINWGAVCPCFNLLSLLKPFCLISPMEIWDAKPVYFYSGSTVFRNIAKGLFGNLSHRK